MEEWIWPLSKQKNYEKKDILNNSDPFAVISVGSQGPKIQTMKATLNQEWNQDRDVKEETQ